MTELRFDGLVAVITGAGRGIGAAYAELLASRGASVVINDLGGAQEGGGADAGPARDTAERIRAAGGQAAPDKSDISTAEGAQALIDTAISTFGRLDIVINNAGLHWTDEFPNIELEDLNRQHAVHVGGSFLVTRAAWPHLVESGNGRVIMTTSTGALGASMYGTYGTAKAGVAGLGRTLAQSGAPLGIKVNIVAPLAMTRMMNQHTGQAEVPNDLDKAPAMTAALVALLAHPDCDVTGETYVAGMRRYTRLFVGETVGYSADHQDIAPEEVKEHWAQINDLSEFNLATDTLSHGDLYEELRGPAPEPAAVQS